MFARLLIIFLPVAFGVVAMQTLPAHALGASSSTTPTGSILIAQVQAGSASGDGAATQEFISLYNNSMSTVDVTNWCISNKTGVSFVCISAPDASTTIMLPSHTYALIASDSFANRYAGAYDAIFTTTNKTSGSLVGGSDTVTLLDGNGNPIDLISWASSLAGGSILTRQWSDQVAGVMLDTYAPADFKKIATLSLPVSGAFEESHDSDICPNIDGVQTTIPSGYGIVGKDCVLDACPNLTGMQAVIPNTMHLVEGKCLYDLPLLLVTELLPNANGSDDDNEYVELYNPSDSPVDLSLYRLQVGSNLEKTYSFPSGSMIDGHTYKAYFNDVIAYTLLNTSSRVRLVSADGQTIDDTPAYVDPAEDTAWAFLNGVWMYTNQPTPGLENLLPTDDSTRAADSITISGLKPCASNQYRNPDTNRCRSIVAAASTLQPCKDGQYRSEETNRCRSIASDASSTKLCAENQFRNPDTGRCKKIASEDEVKDCGEGRERNPATNRCRNVVGLAGGTASGGVKLTPAPAASVLGWWAAGIVGLIAVAYAVLEWRREIGGWVRWIVSIVLGAVRHKLPW